MQGIGRNGRSQKIERLDHVERCRDLAASRRAPLRQNKTLLCRPGGDQQQGRRPRARFEGASQNLAVDRNDLSGKAGDARQAFRKGDGETTKRRLERHRIEGGTPG